MLFHLNENPLCKEWILNEAKDNVDSKDLPNAVHHSEASFDENPNTKAIDLSNEIVICKACKEDFPRNSILKHLAHKDSCKKQYSTAEWQKLVLSCQTSKDLKLRLWNSRRTGVGIHKNPI